MKNVEDIYKIEPFSSNNTYDIVFIHGLGGDEQTTWQFNNNKEMYWPKWLATDLKYLNVWTLNYGASPSKWLSDALPFHDRARNLLNLMSTNGLGKKPIIFIVHSLGGLIIKNILNQAHMLQEEKYNKILFNTKCIIFLAVPHTGSGWADILKYANILTKNTPLISTLMKNTDELRNLSFASNSLIDKNAIKSYVFYEGKKTKRKKFFITYFNDTIVSETSATSVYYSSVPICLTEDHLSISKLESREKQLYKNVIEILKEIIIENDDKECPFNAEILHKNQNSILNSTFEKLKKCHLKSSI